jgi:multiple sugar transport system permease protein
VTWTKKAEPYFYILPASIMIIVFLGYPLVYNIGISFFRWQLAFPDHSFTGLRNYTRILTSGVFGRVLLNTAVWTVGGVCLQMVVGILLAVMVDGMRRWSSRLMQSLILLPWIIPGVVTSVIWMCMLQSDLGVVSYLINSLGGMDRSVLWFSDTRLALISVMIVNTWKAMPFWFLMITAALMDVPRDQVEAARIDGAGRFSVFRHVVLQHLKPVIAATATLTTIWTFNSFDIIWTITRGGPLNATATLPVSTYLLGFSANNFGQASAMAVISVLIVAVVCAPYIRALYRKVRDS